MTTTEKYLKMNNLFVQLRDAIFESDVDEKEEDKRWEESILVSLNMLNNYLDYYKKLNDVKSHPKK